MNQHAPTSPTLRTPLLQPRPIALAVIAMALSACGGGGTDATTAVVPGVVAAVQPQSIAGTVVDGYIAGATINCRKAGILVATTASDSAGRYSFNLASGQSCDTIESVGGVDVGLTPNDTSDDVPGPQGVLRTPVPTGSTSVANLIASPLSTLVAALVDAGSTPAAAQAQVRTSLGLPASADLLGTDPASDASLFKANAVVAQLVEQTADALAAVGGITSAVGRQALAKAASDALAARLSSMNMAALVQVPGALTPSSPLVGLIEQAASNAKANASVAAALQTLNPSTFAALATPLVASATGKVNGATSVADVVARAKTIDDQDRTAAVLGPLSGLVDNTATNAQAVLQDIAAALAAADAGGTNQPIALTIGGESASATASGGLSNYALLVDNQIRLICPSSSSTVTLADFESAGGVTIPTEVSCISFALAKSSLNTQLSSTAIEAPLAVEVSDATRTFQAIIDRVSLTVDVTGNVVATLPAGAKLWVYGKTATTETTSPLLVTLANTGLEIVSSATGTISFSFDRLFEVIGSAAAPGSALDILAANRVTNGTYDVTIAIGTLRVARNAVPTPALAALRAVTLRAGGQSVTGHSFKGKVTVTP